MKQTQITGADSYQSFSPNSILDRASLVKMVILSSGLIQKDADDCMADKLTRKWQFVYYKDVKVNDWYAPYVCIGAEKNLLPKFGKFLKPSKKVTFLEALQVLFYGLNQKGFFLNIDPNSHPKVLFLKIQELGLQVNLSGIHKKISRGDFARLLFALSKLSSPQTDVSTDEITPDESNSETDSKPLRPITRYIPSGSSGSCCSGSSSGSGGGGGGGGGGSYNPPVTPPIITPNPILPDSNTRAMWVWGYWGQLNNNPANTSDFINFLKSPHGNSAYAINRIFLSPDNAVNFANPADVTSMQNFLRVANANGIVTEALFSEYTWVRTAEKNIPIALCQNIIDYNKITTATDDDFAGIHFDIEPHTLPEWTQNSAGGADGYNNELEANLLDIMTQCRQKITASGLALTLTLDVPYNWHNDAADLWAPLTAINSPVNYITVMNYFDSPERFINGWGTTGGVKNILLTGGNVPMVFGAEISDVTGIDDPSVTFYEEGYLAMENAFNSAKSQYAGNTLFRGLSIEHYNTYKIAQSAPPLPPPPPPPPTSGCSANQTVFRTDKSVLQEPILAKPATGSPFRDPIFDTCVTRITDVSTDLIAPDTSKGFKNEYSRVNSWNSDQSKILIRSLSANWYVYNAQTLKPVKMLSVGGSIDPRWDASNPDILYFIEGTALKSYNISNDNITVLRDFPGDFPGQTVSAVWTRYEGSPTADSRYWGLMAEDQNWNTFAFLIYDAQQNIITAQRTLTQPYDIDNVSISPLGNYFTAFYDVCPAGTLGTDQSPCGLMVYDNSLQNGRGLLRAIGHSDFAIDANNREVFVYQDVSTDNISVLDLGTGAITDLFPIDFSHSPLGMHISGQNFSKPGWALISMYNGSYPVNMTWMDNQIFAVELATGRVFRIAHHHSLYNENMAQDYWAEPQASVNRDFTKILFTSNWGKSGTEETDAYLVTLPSDWSSKAFNPPTYWVPPKTTSFDIQFQSPVNQTVTVNVMDVDMFDTDASVVASLHAQGKKVFCYISAGSYENWRPDQASFPPSVLGNDYVGWPGEKWLDIRQISILAPIMRARMDLCKSKGFDGIDFDNISGYQNNTGFPLAYADQLAYNKWLATEAHSRGLSVGLKNDGAQVTDLLSDFDWAITESCYADGWCNEMKPFADAGKAVFMIEYTENGTTLADFCPTAAALGFNGLLKHLDLGDYREYCL